MESSPGHELQLHVPEILLAAAVVSISPLFLWIILGDRYLPGDPVLLSFFSSVILSVAYLHIDPNQGDPGSNSASSAGAKPEKLHFSFIKYDWVLLAYGIAFAMSYAVVFLPYLLWWAFLPFHSVMVMATTIRRTNVKPRSNYLLRIALSILLCIGGFLYPFYVGSHFYLT